MPLAGPVSDPDPPPPPWLAIIATYWRPLDSYDTGTPDALPMNGADQSTFPES
jgi:hypothetical protein